MNGVSCVHRETENAAHLVAVRQLRSYVISKLVVEGVVHGCCSLLLDARDGVHSLCCCCCCYGCCCHPSTARPSLLKV